MFVTSFTFFSRDAQRRRLNKERQLRDADSRLGEYIEALEKSRDILRRYFKKHGKDIFEEWEKEEKEKEKPKIEADLIDDD
jgi:hypothetical protein